MLVAYEVSSQYGVIAGKVDPFESVTPGCNFFGRLGAINLSRSLHTWKRGYSKEMCTQKLFVIENRRTGSLTCFYKCIDWLKKRWRYGIFLENTANMQRP